MDANAKTKTCYEKKKPSIYKYKWRENNKEKYNIICNKAQAIYYVKNKEKISQRKKEWYARRKAERLAMDNLYSLCPVIFEDFYFAGILTLILRTRIQKY